MKHIKRTYVPRVRSAGQSCTGAPGLSPARRLATDAALLGVALMLSYIESILPLGLIVPLPGIKLGLANIVIVLLVWRGYAGDGAAVSFTRICLASVLFGGPLSFAISLAGGIFAFAALCLCAFILRRFVGLLGTSVLCAAAHNAGQISAAALLLYDGAVFSYLPVLLAAALITGTVTGIALILLERVKVKIP